MSFQEEMELKYGVFEGFIYKPLKRANNGKVCLHGINDLEFSAQPKIDNKQLQHPGYISWRNMLNRSHDYNLDKYPSYENVVCSEEWIYSSNYLVWFKNSNRSSTNTDLDKDLLVSENLVYSKETCLFVPKEINSFLTIANSIRGGQPLGVDLSPGGYRSRISDGKSKKHLGYFKSPEEAHKVWQSAKLERAMELQLKYIYIPMSRVITKLQNDINNNLETKFL